MWKRLTLVFLLFWGGFFSVVEPVKAICQCAKWEYKYKCGEDGCTGKAYCAALNCYSQKCGPGTYPCNRGCCAIGTNPNRPDNSGCEPGNDSIALENRSRS
jgi:hypothetical protein